jgi:hypothetical protein
MIIAFTQSRSPNWFERAITQVDGSLYTHVVAFTGVTLPHGDPLVLHSNWNTGLALVPASVAIGSNKTIKFEDGCVFDWEETIECLRKYSGAENYGWAQIVAHLISYLGFKVPASLKKRFASEMYCSEVIVRMNQNQNKMTLVKPDQTGPGALLRYCLDNLERVK